MTIIYEPDPHYCERPKTKAWCQIPIDTVWRCNHCGKYWLRVWSWGKEYDRPVRWYDLTARRKIRQWENAHPLSARRFTAISAIRTESRYVTEWRNDD